MPLYEFKKDSHGRIPLWGKNPKNRNDNCYIGHGAIVIGPWAIVAEGCVIPQKSIVPGEKIVGGVPFVIIGNVENRHKEFWTYGKQLYVDLARDYPAKFEKL